MMGADHATDDVRDTPIIVFAGGRTPKARSQSTPRGGISGVVSCVATCAANPEPAFS